MDEYCDMCYSVDTPLIPTPVGIRCRECANWEFYWHSLTPKQQAEELRMMDFHEEQRYTNGPA